MTKTIHNMQRYTPTTMLLLCILLSLSYLTRMISADYAIQHLFHLVTHYLWLGLAITAPWLIES